MIPLHADDPLRQRALLANGLRLYGRFFAESVLNGGRLRHAA